VLYDNSRPRYLPHLDQPEILRMGLSPLGGSAWIETDDDFPQFHAHKRAQRARLGAGACRALPSSMGAQRELAALLQRHLVAEQDGLYRETGGALEYVPTGLRLPPPGDEPLWNSSLWVADDLVIMQEREGAYRLTAASLCSPSDWLLEEKFDRPLAEIHAPIPGFAAALTPSVDRFFAHLGTAHPVVRFNWSLQAGGALCQRPGDARAVDAAAPLYYRCERQSLRRLPDSGAVAFTIRVYLHPLASLQAFPGALRALFAAVDATSPGLARYKGFDALAPALAKYRAAS
jgi:hypothetical protein